MTQNSFILYTNYKPIVELFTMEERGMLWTAIFDHVVGEEKILLPDNVKIAFEFIKNQLNVDLAKYERIVERNREIASTRKTKEKKQSLVVNEHHWSPVVTSGKSGTPNDNENNNDNKNKNNNDNVNENGNKNVSDNDNENDNENDNDNDNENDNDNDNGNDNRIVKGRRKGLASLGEILSASPFSSPENGALPVWAQGGIVGTKGDVQEQGMTMGTRGDKRMPPEFAGGGLCPKIVSCLLNTYQGLRKQVNFWGTNLGILRIVFSSKARKKMAPLSRGVLSKKKGGLTPVFP